MEQLFLSTTTLDDIIGGDGWVILIPDVHSASLVGLIFPLFYDWETPDRRPEIQFG